MPSSAWKKNVNRERSFEVCRSSGTSSFSQTRLWRGALTVSRCGPRFTDRAVYGGFLFFFNDTATTEIYTLSLHDALPICQRLRSNALGSGKENALEAPAT